MSEIDLQDIKRRFLAFRNGVVSDTLRKAGMPYKIIFGLQLPQLSEIAGELEKSPELARGLWADKGVRESRLLAAWIFPHHLLSESEAECMMQSVITREEADILAFRLIKFTPFASELSRRLAKHPDPIIKYAASAIMRNLE